MKLFDQLVKIERLSVTIEVNKLHPLFAAEVIGIDAARPDHAAVELVEVYERRRDLVVAGLERLGWEVVRPEGTFFVWAKAPGGDAVAFAEQLRERARVAVAPGDGFGALGRGYVRLALVEDEATLAETIERLAAFGTGESHG